MVTQSTVQIGATIRLMFDHRVQLCTVRLIFGLVFLPHNELVYNFLNLSL